MVGMQPRFKQVPPNRSFSMIAVFSPADDDQIKIAHNFVPFLRGLPGLSFGRSPNLFLLKIFAVHSFQDIRKHLLFLRIRRFMGCESFADSVLLIDDSGQMFR